MLTWQSGIQMQMQQDAVYTLACCILHLDVRTTNKDTSRVQYIDPGGLVRCADAPPVRICNVCDIYELAEAENRAGKASDGPEHGPRGRSPNRVVVGPRQACS